MQTEDSDNDEQLELFKANETLILHGISPARKRTMRSGRIGMNCLKQMIKRAYRTNLNNAPMVFLIDAHGVKQLLFFPISCDSVAISKDNYYITPLVTNVNTDRCQKKNGVLMFNRLWFPEITDTQTFYFLKTL